MFDPDTEVGSLAFSFPDGQTFPTSELQKQMVLDAPGFFSGVRSKLDFLPFIPAPAPHPFTPLNLQRDVARIRNFYAQSGFIGTDVRYEVTYDEKDDEVAVDMIVSEGRPIILRSVSVVTCAGART